MQEVTEQKEAAAGQIGRTRPVILGVAIDCLSMEETVSRIDELIATGKPHIVVTADTSGLVQGQTDPELHRIHTTADLVTPDSIGVIWALKRRGVRQARVTGVDLVGRLAELSARKGHSIFLLGSAPGVAEEAAERLRLLYPGCNIIGARHGYFPADDDTLVAEEIAPTKPDILLVAMGIPRQEKFIDRTKHIIGAKIGIGVGGSLDVYSGRAKRAPKIIQALHIEWLWRVLLNPKKISKAKNLPVFAWWELTRRS